MKDTRKTQTTVSVQLSEVLGILVCHISSYFFRLCNSRLTGQSIFYLDSCETHQDPRNKNCQQMAYPTSGFQAGSHAHPLCLDYTRHATLSWLWGILTCFLCANSARSCQLPGPCRGFLTMMVQYVFDFFVEKGFEKFPRNTWVDGHATLCNPLMGCNAKTAWHKDLRPYV